MRLIYSFRFQQIGETYLGAAVGQNAHLFNGVLQLNEVGHFIVSELEKIVSADSADLTESAIQSTDSSDLTESAILSTDSTNLTEEKILSLLTDSLTNEYAVDRSTAQSAVQDVLSYLKSEQVLAK